MREKGNNNQFRSGADKPDRFWLKLSNDSAVSHLLFGIIDDATLEFDKHYDAPKRYAQQNLNLSAQLPAGEEMMILGIPKPLFETPYVIPLTVQSNTPGTVAFSIPRDEILDDQIDVALIDHLNRDTAFVMNEAYNTTIDSAGKITDRFEILFFIKGSLQDTATSTHSVPKPDKLKIFAVQNRVVVESQAGVLKTVIISDVSGKILWSEPNSGRKRVEVSGTNWSPGVYIIQATTENGGVKSQKVVLGNL